MFAGLANYVAGPQSILEKMDSFEKAEENVLRKDEEFQYPTKDYLPRSVTSPVPAVMTSGQFGGVGRPTAYSEYTPQSPNRGGAMLPRFNEYELFPPTEPGFSKSSSSIPNIIITPNPPSSPNYYVGGNNLPMNNTNNNMYSNLNTSPTNLNHKTDLNTNTNNNNQNNTRIRLSSSGQSLSSSWAEDIKVA